ncbi:fibrinolytic enzyme, isozyme C-like isoform X2 [Gigantopelta aegis]|uniref:fibrinolytic enzyme, isozyme C-like isoform X2 n=1 Tax=Gigantopelta aegis TaxID=1735272 RepID=UPI001B889F7A|nr:fibrinolytic enzyme, isozyme C-like isoform X2 [Gigantopelta aegis]
MSWISGLVCLIFVVCATSSPSKRIVGGTDSDITEFPHTCSLRYNGSPSCGCSILGPRKVLTSANCVVGRTASQMSVHHGSSSLLGSSVDVIDFRVHENFRNEPGHADGSYANNIAVIDVAEDIGGAIAVASPADGNFAGENCTITGWGSVDGSYNLSQTLQKAEITVLTNQECADAMSGIGIINEATHICVKSPRNDTGGCHGDYGGPLTCDTVSGPVLAGVMSWGVGQLCDTSYPTGYTRLSSYVDWI